MPSVSGYAKREDPAILPYERLLISTGQFLHDPLVGRIVFLQDLGLIVVLARGGGDGTGDHGEAAQIDGAVGTAEHFLLQDGGVGVAGVGVAAEGEIAQGVEDHAVLIVLDGLKDVGMVAGDKHAKASNILIASNLATEA